MTTVAAGTTGSSLATTYQTSAAYLDVKTSAVNTQGLFWWSRISGDPVPVSSVFPLLSAPLPAVDKLIRAEVPDDPINNPPEHVTSKPIPVAFLPAPPAVAGAGQQGDAPEFAAVTRSTNGTTTSTSSSLSATLGVEIEDVTGAYGASFAVSMANEVSDENTVERTVQTAQAFRGLEDDNVVVYRRVPITRWNGTITESSTGIGIGEPTSVDLTDGNVVTTATNVGALAAQYPELYGDGGELEPVLDRVFSNTVGDPGSYPQDTANNAGVDAMCDGSVSPTGPRELPDLSAFVPENPYQSPPTTPLGPDVIVSDVHQVVTGSGNSEGALFTMEDAYTNSRVQTTLVRGERPGQGQLLHGRRELRPVRRPRLVHDVGHGRRLLVVRRPHPVRQPGVGHGDLLVAVVPVPGDHSGHHRRTGDRVGAPLRDQGL